MAHGVPLSLIVTRAVSAVAELLVLHTNKLLDGVESIASRMTDDVLCSLVGLLF